MEQHADYSWKVPDMQHNGHYRLNLGGLNFTALTRFCGIKVSFNNMWLDHLSKTPLDDNGVVL